MLNAANPQHVATYIRFSTEDQGEGHTIELQEAECRRVYQAQGWKWDDSLVFIDEGKCGTNLDRPAMERLRRDIRDRRVDCVVVYRLDRLSRSTVDCLTLIRDEWYGICHFVSATDRISTLDGTAEMMLPLLSVVGEMDRNRIVGTMRAGKYAAARKGQTPGGRPPFGYEVDPTTKKYVINEQEAAVVRRIFDDYRSVGCVTIAQRLNAEGIPSASGKTWSNNTVAQVLKNPAYCGTQVYGRKLNNPRRRRHKGEPRLIMNEAPTVVQGVYPIVVSEEEFEAARAKRERHGDITRGRRSARSVYLLTGIIKCSKCGRAIVGKTSGGKYHQQHYVCNGIREGRRECDCRYMDRKDLESKVVEEVKKTFSVGNRDLLVTHATERLSNRVAEANAALKRHRGALEGINRSRDKWETAFEAGTFSADQVKRRLDSLDVEEREVKAEIQKALDAVHDAERASAEADIHSLVQMAEQLDVWEAMSDEQRKTVLQYLVKEIRAYVAPDGRRFLSMVLRTDMKA